MFLDIYFSNINEVVEQIATAMLSPPTDETVTHAERKSSDDDDGNVLLMPLLVTIAKIKQCNFIGLMMLFSFHCNVTCFSMFHLILTKLKVCTMVLFKFKLPLIESTFITDISASNMIDSYLKSLSNESV